MVTCVYKAPPSGAKSPSFDLPPLWIVRPSASGLAGLASCTLALA
jgi:hypothetical protein